MAATIKFTRHHERHGCSTISLTLQTRPLSPDREAFTTGSSNISGPAHFRSSSQARRPEIGSGNREGGETLACAPAVRSDDACRDHDAADGKPGIERSVLTRRAVGSRVHTTAERYGQAPWSAAVAGQFRAQPPIKPITAPTPLASLERLGLARSDPPFAFMKQTRIDLSQPFEQVLATVLSLPRTADDTLDTDRELKQVLRGLYEAANGRQVDTTLGLIPIAPPVAEFLKETPFEVATQFEFVIKVTATIIAGRPGFADAFGASEALHFGNGRAAMSANRIGLQMRRVDLRPQGVSHG